MSNRLLYSIIFVSLLVIDQLVKLWARSAFVVGEKPGYPWPGVFELTLTYNQGIAFGMFQGAALLVTPIAILIAGAATYWVWTRPDESKLSVVAWAMIASGAIGNLIDRIWLGKVTDMFWFRLIDFPVFNVADSAISVGAVLLICSYLFESGRKSEPKPASNGIEENNESNIR
ncbi:MAG: signal peptidase II [Fimbriimonadaceae bacterium]